MRYRIGKNMFGSLWLLASALMLGGCVADEGDCLTDSRQLPVTLQLNVKVPASSPATRAGGHSDEVGTAAENAINLKNQDFRVLLFDSKTGELIKEWSPSSTETQSSGNYDTYILKGPISETLIGSIDNADKKLDKFKIMVLANWGSFNVQSSPTNKYPDNFSKYAIPVGDTTDDASGNGNSTGGGRQNIFKEATSLNFTMPHTKDSQSTISWQPSLGGTATPVSLIPMFGYSRELDLHKDGDQNGTTMNMVADISMLRSLAKVEIVDAMDKNGAEIINAVSLSRSNAKGRFIPDIDNEKNGAWNTTQLSAPSLPDIYLSNPKETDNAFVQNLSFVKASYTRTYTDENGVSRECPVYVAYIPEMHLSSSQTGLERPSFNVYINNGTEPKTMKFDNYINGKQNMANQLTSVLRNHIYQYYVTGNAASIDLSLKILPWDMQYDEDVLNYDNPAVANDGWLKWNTIDVSVQPGVGTEEDPVSVSNGYIDFDYNYVKGKYYGEDNDNPALGNLRLKMKPGAYSDNEYVEGTFTLGSPMNSKWYATLVQIDDKRNTPFSFVDIDDEGKVTNVDADGNLVVKSEISGIIDGNAIKLRIANCDQNVTDSENEARLVVMVELPSGQRMEVPVVREPDARRTNYILFQERTDI